MNRQMEIKVYDTWENLPECSWKELIVDFEKDFAVKQYAIFAYVEDEIAGFMRVLRNPDDICEWYTCDVHVIEHHRRKGIATLMYRKTIELVSWYERATKIITSISAFNSASIQLHKRIGFTDTGITSSFTDCIFEEDETIYCYWLEAKLYPAKNSPFHVEMLFPMWKAYMEEAGENDTEEGLRSGLVSRLEISQLNENVFFELMWSGDDAIGFVQYAVSGGAEDAIPSGYGHIKEFFVREEWRNKEIGTRCVNRVCDTLLSMGCPKIYVTDPKANEKFLKKTGFTKSDLLAQDNSSTIWLRDEM